MVKKASVRENELYILPTPNSAMVEFVNKFKVDMMQHIVNSIKFAVENEMSMVEVFQFKNSSFVITIAEKEFISNLEHINKYYVENEIFELCPKVEELCHKLKSKTDEKENPDKSKPDNSESK